jgi:hypothetical protein
LKLWNDFFDYLLPDAPGCPHVAAIFALRQAAIAFCEQSLVWTYAHPDIPVVVDVDQYEFDPPDGAIVHAVTYSSFNDTEIDTNVKQDDMHIKDWRKQTGSPKYVLGSPSFLTLVPKPDVAGTLKLIVVLKPDTDATGIDDDIFREYREPIVHGALSRLMSSPRKPYTNLQLSTYHMQQCTIKTAAAGQRMARNLTRAPLQTSIMKRSPA